DDPLFVRSGGSMTPTPAAQNLIGPVREALRRLQSGLDSGTRFDPATASRVFHLAMNDVQASLVMPELLASLQKRAPGVRVQCHQVDRSEVESELAAGTLDFAFDIPQLGRGRLREQPVLKNQSYVCLLRRGHPMARQKLTLERYLALPQVTVSAR